MSGDQMDGFLFVARTDGFRDHGVGDAGLNGFLIAVGENDLHLTQKLVLIFYEDRIFGYLAQLAMEIIVVPDAAGPAFLGRFIVAGLVGDGSEHLKFFIAAPVDRKAHRHGIDRDTDDPEVLNVLFLIDRNFDEAVRVDMNKPFALQLLESISDRRAADAEI